MKDLAADRRPRAGRRGVVGLVSFNRTVLLVSFLSWIFARLPLPQVEYFSLRSSTEAQKSVRPDSRCKAKMPFRQSIPKPSSTSRAPLRQPALLEHKLIRATSAGLVRRVNDQQKILRTNRVFIFSVSPGKLKVDVSKCGLGVAAPVDLDIVCHLRPSDLRPAHNRLIAYHSFWTLKDQIDHGAARTAVVRCW